MASVSEKCSDKRGALALPLLGWGALPLFMVGCGASTPADGGPGEVTSTERQELTVACRTASQQSLAAALVLAEASAKVSAACGKPASAQCTAAMQAVQQAAAGATTGSRGIRNNCGPTECLDFDKDGFTTCDGDCNDKDPKVYPGAPETPDDGIDQDCSGGDLVCQPPEPRRADLLALQRVDTQAVPAVLHSAWLSKPSGPSLVGACDLTSALVSTPEPGKGRVAVGDVDGDGHADVAIAQPYSLVDGARTDFGFAFEIASGNGDGTFRPVATDTPVATELAFYDDTFLRFADVNGDGRADALFLTKFTGDGVPGLFIDVALSRGDGTFGAVTSTSIGARDSLPETRYEIADVNHDGRADLVLLLPYSGDGVFAGIQYDIALGNGDGTFHDFVGPSGVATTLHGSDPATVYLKFGDTTGDGLTDLSIIAPIDGGLLWQTAKGNGDGSFTIDPDITTIVTNIACPTGAFQPTDVAIADLD